MISLDCIKDDLNQLWAQINPSTIFGLREFRNVSKNSPTSTKNTLWCHHRDSCDQNIPQHAWHYWKPRWILFPPWKYFKFVICINTFFHQVCFKLIFLVKETILHQMYLKGIPPRYFNRCSCLYMWTNMLLNTTWIGLLMLLLIGNNILIIHSSKIIFYIQCQLFCKNNVMWVHGNKWPPNFQHINPIFVIYFFHPIPHILTSTIFINTSLLNLIKDWSQLVKSNMDSHMKRWWENYSSLIKKIKNFTKALATSQCSDKWGPINPK